ncbi:MAG TPA: AAA family ATPase [Candidatus Aquilonibacter sp.]|nr:AAA family ATPase [Candidatus Aquilonibacter sp.]
MDVISPPEPEVHDADPKQQLVDDVERVRTQREDLDRQIVSDREKLATIRTALDAMIAALWRDVFGQQQSTRERENITSALTFGWLQGYQWISIVAMVALAAGAIGLLAATGAIVAVGLYVVLALVGYVVARDQCLSPIRKTRASYLGDEGKDLRFVAFAHYEPGLHHPLIGFDGPVNGQLEDRSWKIPGVRDKDALDETFLEVIDERRSNVLLTRFPDKKPTLVHADLENPFIRAYGVFFQRALERHMMTVQAQAEEFREVVKHFGTRKTLDERLKRLEGELSEFDGTAAIMRALPVSVPVRNELLRQVVLFRLGEASIARGMFLITGDRADATEILQTIARASAASLLRLSFSQIKIGYVGQGASTVSRMFEAAKRAKSILFIDEAERFFGTGGSAQYESMRREAVAAIVKEWEALEDRSDVWIVAAAKTREGLDDGVVARFGKLIDLYPSDDAHTTTVITTDGDAPAGCADAALPELINERIRLLAAMFSHIDAMEGQGIAVPRAVLVTGPSLPAQRAVINGLAAQTELPVIDALVDDVDTALLAAREQGSAVLAVDVPEYAAPGAVAHLAILIDELKEKKVPVFVVATAVSPQAVDPELRARFAEVLDLSELSADARRRKLRELLAEKPLGFDLDAALEQLESQTDGMREEDIRAFVDDASRKAALRAIESGESEHVVLTLTDFERRHGPSPIATKDDEAAL